MPQFTSSFVHSLEDAILKRHLTDVFLPSEPDRAVKHAIELLSPLFTSAHALICIMKLFAVVVFILVLEDAGVVLAGRLHLEGS